MKNTNKFVTTDSVDKGVSGGGGYTFLEKA